MRTGRFSRGYMSIRSRRLISPDCTFSRVRASGRGYPRSRSLLLPELLAQALALLGGKLLPALAELLPLLGRHLLPAREVLVDAFALLRRHRLIVAEALLDPPLSLGRQPLKTLVGALQLLPARLRQLVPALEVLDDAGTLRRRPLAAPLEVVAGRLAVLWRHALPLPAVLDHALALVGRELLPPLEVALDDRALFGPETVHALGALAPGHVQHGQHEHRDEQQHPRHDAGHHFVSLSAGAIGAAESRIRQVSSILIRSSSRMRPSSSRSRATLISRRRSRSRSMSAVGGGVAGAPVGGVAA